MPACITIFGHFQIEPRSRALPHPTCRVKLTGVAGAAKTLEPAPADRFDLATEMSTICEHQQMFRLIDRRALNAKAG